MIGKVRHSYSSSHTPLKPWVLVKSNGSVICGHCTCMAGQGETCSRVGAILLWVETQVRKRDQTSCTSKENTWIMPKVVKDIPFLMLEEIDFSTAKKRVNNSLANIMTPISATINYNPPTDKEQVDFLNQIAKETTSTPVILSLITPYYSTKFTQSFDILPASLQSLFNPMHLELNYVQLLELATQYTVPTTTAVFCRM